MDITSCYDIDSIIREFEAAFQVDGTDFEERDVDVILKNVKTRVGRQYQVDLTEFKIDSPEFDIGVYHNAAALFIDNVARLHAKLCGLCQICRYLTVVNISLSDINFLGYTEESLKTMLQALQRKATLPMAEEAVQSVKRKLGSINNCREKRLFLIMVISYTIGFHEVTASVAELLYLGGLR